VIDTAGGSYRTTSTSQRAAPLDVIVSHPSSNSKPPPPHIPIPQTMSTTNMLSLMRWAVVGDVMNASKPASSVLARLQSSGKEVYAINSRDDKCLASLHDIPGEQVDAVNLIVNSKVGLTIVDQMIELKINNLFIQPGAGSADLIAKAKAGGLEVREGCVLVEPIPAPVGAKL
jgi:predicted CoA-binding protein